MEGAATHVASACRALLPCFSLQLLLLAFVGSRTLHVTTLDRGTYHTQEMAHSL